MWILDCRVLILLVLKPEDKLSLSQPLTRTRKMITCPFPETLDNERIECRSEWLWNIIGHGPGTMCSYTNGTLTKTFKCTNGAWQEINENSVDCPSNITATVRPGKVCGEARWKEPAGNFSRIGGDPGECFNSTRSIFYTGSNGIVCKFTVSVTVNYCPPLAAFSHGRHNCTGEADNVGGSACSLSCNSGFSLLGNMTVKCISDQTSAHWNSSFPSCIAVCPALPELPFLERNCSRGVKDRENSNGSVCHHACNATSRLQGSAIIQCQFNSTSSSADWNKPSPTCEVRECPILPALPYSNHTCTGDSDNTFESTCVFSCNSGFLLLGNQTVQCIDDGISTRWNSSFPTCIESFLEKEHSEGLIIGTALGAAAAIFLVGTIAILIWKLCTRVKSRQHSSNTAMKDITKNKPPNSIKPKLMAAEIHETHLENDYDTIENCKTHRENGYSTMENCLDVTNPYCFINPECANKGNSYRSMRTIWLNPKDVPQSTKVREDVTKYNDTESNMQEVCDYETSVDCHVTNTDISPKI